MDFSAIAEQLGRSGLCIQPDFLPSGLLANIQADFAILKAGHSFQPAGTGQGRGHEVRTRIRNDLVYWLEQREANPVQLLLWEQLRLLQEAFNRTLFLGLNAFEGHYAAYDAGGFYQRHVDTFQGDASRVVSLVLYLNRDWQKHDGGQLRFYAAANPQDVAPVGGTLVVFLSQGSEHEILLSHAPRLSFTGWFKRAPTPYCLP